jgi:hypothetical protein
LAASVTEPAISGWSASTEARLALTKNMYAESAPFGLGRPAGCFGLRGRFGGGFSFGGFLGAAGFRFLGLGLGRSSSGSASISRW